MLFGDLFLKRWSNLLDYELVERINHSGRSSDLDGAPFSRP
jgi:hypothetical protein